MLNLNMGNSKKIDIGIVGAGHLGSFHIEQYKELNNVNIVGFTDINRAQINQIKNKYNINAFDSLDELQKH